MWVNDPDTLPADYAWTGTGTPPAKLLNWFNNIQSGGGALPGVNDSKPTVIFGANNLVTVTIFWKPPQSDRFHSHTLITTINQDPES
jgi:type IV pilus assembly protein PilV